MALSFDALAALPIAKVSVAPDGIHFLPQPSPSVTIEMARSSLERTFERQGFIPTFVMPASHCYAFPGETGTSTRIDRHNAGEVDFGKLRKAFAAHEGKVITLGELVQALLAGQKFRRKEVEAER